MTATTSVSDKYSFSGELMIEAVCFYVGVAFFIGMCMIPPFIIIAPYALPIVFLICIIMNIGFIYRFAKSSNSTLIGGGSVGTIDTLVEEVTGQTFSLATFEEAAEGAVLDAINALDGGGGGGGSAVNSTNVSLSSTLATTITGGSYAGKYYGITSPIISGYTTYARSDSKYFLIPYTTTTTDGNTSGYAITNYDNYISAINGDLGDVTALSLIIESSVGDGGTVNPVLPTQ